MTEQNFYKLGILLIYLLLGVLSMLARDMRDILLNIYIYLTFVPFLITYIIYLIRSSKNQKPTAGLYISPLHFAVISIIYTTLASTILNLDKGLDYSVDVGLSMGIFSAIFGVLFGYTIIITLRVIAKIVFSEFFAKPLTRR
jgi:hypothetical protein